MTGISTNDAESQVRSIQPQDAPAVCTLIEQLGYSRSLDDVAHWIKTLPERSEIQTAFVATLGAEIIGWIEVSIERRLQSPPFAFIGGLVVKDGFRGRHVGRRLCTQAEAWSWEHRIPVVRVTSRSTRLDAHRFYLQNGYEATKISHVFEKQMPK
jgi:GNAT superfamily N-acetyltransferase